MHVVLLHYGCFKQSNTNTQKRKMKNPTFPKGCKKSQNCERLGPKAHGGSAHGRSDHENQFFSIGLGWYVPLALLNFRPAFVFLFPEP